eukprot:441080_1
MPSAWYLCTIFCHSITIVALSFSISFGIFSIVWFSLTKQRYYQYAIIIIIPMICCIVPILFAGINVYGAYNNNNSADKQCWLRKKQWQLIFVFAILLSLIFHYIVLGIFCCKSKNAMSSQYGSIIKRLMRFVIVYTILRALPAIERIWEVVSDSSPPLWLVMSHHICIASVGIANAVVWTINESKNVNPPQPLIIDSDETTVQSSNAKTSLPQPTPVQQLNSKPVMIRLH